MAIHILPVVPSIAFYRIGVTIEDVHYVMDFQWNSTESAWYFDMYDLDENPIIVGVKVVLGAFLGRTANALPFKDGILVAVDTTRKGKEAGFDDLGTRVELRYLPTLDFMSNLAEVYTRDAELEG